MLRRARDDGIGDCPGNNERIFWTAFRPILYPAPMCGRIMQRAPLLPGLQSELGATEETLAGAWTVHNNGAPGQSHWVIRRERNGSRNLRDLLQWGLVPNWVPDPGNWPKPINAKCETIRSNGSFRDAYRTRRCLVPIDLFFEWHKILGTDGKPVKGRKQPYAIAMADGQPFALAGLWESWTDKTTGQVTRSFTIITCEANALVAGIHDRMPVILALEHYERWLANVEPDPFDLLVPYPPELMAMWPISSRVNSPGYNEPDIAEPVVI
jgi:putative SOS response-associated peptidase YedK